MKTKQHILFVATSVPEDSGGAPIRNYYLLKHLTLLPNTQVGLICLCSERRIYSIKQKLEAELPITAELLPYRQRNLLTKLRAVAFDRMQPYMTEYKRDTKLAEAVRNYCVNTQPDVIQIEQIDAYYCLLPHIKWFKSQGIKIVLDEHNIETEAFKGSLETLPFFTKIIGRRLVTPLRNLENHAIENSDIVFGCSENDTDFFRRLRDDKPSFLVPNGVDCSHYASSQAGIGNPTLLFMGGVGYPPNADALKYYLHEIHAQVKQAFPNVKLLIIGSGTTEWLQSQGFAGDESLQALGFVDDIKPYLKQAAVGICPIRQGSGTRIKLLTYMAAGLPVVSTTKGAEGIDYRQGVELNIADDPEAFALSIVKLLKDKFLRQNMGRAGRELMDKSYDWAAIGATLRELYKTHIYEQTRPPKSR